MSETKPRSHRVAQSAYSVVDARKTFAEQKVYGALAHKLPILILQNGLAQATGFLLAKGKAEHLALLDDLTMVLRETGETGCNNPSGMHQTVIAADTPKTMHLTRRALEASGWIKRYVQGVLKVDATGEAEAS
jgi:CRISPR-associated protein Cmr5